MSNKTREAKQRFTLRKNKRYKNVVSVGLGLFIAMGVGVATNEAYASEDIVNSIVKTENPATNAPEAQPKSTEEAVSSIGKIGETTGNVDINVDKTKVDEAVENAKNNGLKVEKEADKDLGTAKSIEEARQKQAEVNKDYKNQETEINKKTEEFKKEDEKYKEKKKKVDDANKKLKEDYEKEKEKAEKLAKEIADINKLASAEKRAEYERKLSEYKKLKSEYEKKLEELELNKNKDGYLSEVIPQNLVYSSEPEAKVSIEAGSNTITYNPNRALTEVYSTESHDINYIGNDVITATYTNLKNSTYKGKPISKVIYEIKRESAGNNPINLSILKDPTSGIAFDSVDPLQKVSIKIKMYDNNNDIIKFSEDAPALIGLSSITTNGYPGDAWREVIQDYNFDFVKITGSSVEEHSDGIYSLSDNKFVSKGARFSHEESDFEGSPYYWYLGAAGKISRGDFIKMTFYSQVDIRSQFWMSINTKVATVTDIPNAPFPPEEPNYEPEKPGEPKEVKPPKYNPYPDPPKPREVKPPKYEDDPKAPEVPTVKYHYVNFNVEPNIYKEVKNSSNIDINKNLVPKLSEVKWELKTENLASNREETTLFEITDNLPTGFDFDLEKSREASKLFEVSYNKNTHTVFYKGNNELIKKINADLTKELITPFPVAIGKVVNDGGTYENNFKLNINNKYTRYSNKVVVYTPGNDPKKPRPPYPTIPGQPGENPTPNDNLIKPEKHNTNKAGVVIDGKTLLPNTVNYYKLLWDLDQYKGIKSTKEDILKGFFYIEDYPEEALELNKDGVTLVDSKGQAVKGVKSEVFESVEKSTDTVKNILEKSKITPKGSFQLFIAENPEQFFNDYVVKGNSITITVPMTIKNAFTGEYTNKAYQIDFGNGYEAEPVVNNVPKLDPQKDVVIDVTHSKESLDGKTLDLGKVFNYHLVGAKLPTNRAEEINQYGFKDDYDEKGDQYDGVYKVFTTIDITLKDKTVIQKGTEVTKHTVQVLDTEKGLVNIEVDKDFLSKVSTDSEFQLDVYLQMKRISTGEVKNTFINTINGYETISNTVTTNTPEPPKPEEPKKPEPKKPTPPSPEKPRKVLPKTSVASGTSKEDNTSEAIALGLATLGAVSLATRRKKQN